MKQKSVLFELIVKQGVLPLYFHKDTIVSVEILKVLYQEGIRAVEYTNRGEAALENFKEMRKVCDDQLPGMSLGIGTIKNREMAQQYVEAGADFIVCPGLVEEVAEVADQHDMLWVPGCMTPSEIIRAENMGAKMIKLFPGNILGTDFMSAIKSLFPQLSFMPTGGVDLDEDNMRSWFKAGVRAVGMGSKLISNKLMEEKDYKKIGELTAQAIRMVEQVRNTNS